METITKKNELPGLSAGIHTPLLTEAELLPAEKLWGMDTEEDEDQPAYEFASLGKRMAAYLIDLIIIVTAFTIVKYIDSVFLPYLHLSLYYSIITFIVLSTLYYGLFESSVYQATPGKQIYHIKVVDAHGQRLKFYQSSLRFLVSFISILPAGFGFWDMEATPNFQTWHDKLIGCYVIMNIQVNKTVTLNFKD